MINYFALMFVTDDKVIRSVAEPEQVEPKLFQI